MISYAVQQHGFLQIIDENSFSHEGQFFFSKL